MHATLRPYVTAGVALVGASMIAITPLAAAPLMSDLQIADIDLTAATDGLLDPLTSWIDVFGTSFNNIANIGQQMLAEPLPVLSQLLINQLGYADTLVTGLSGASQALINQLTTALPAALNTAFDQLAAGDVYYAAMTIAFAIQAVVIQSGFPLFPVLAIPNEIAQNLESVTGLFTDPFGFLLPALNAFLGTVQGTILEAGEVGQAFVDALDAGDTSAALGALLNAPADITGAFLNGYEVFGMPGLFSSEGGIVGPIDWLLVEFPQAIATALGAPAGGAGLAGVADAVQALGTDILGGFALPDIGLDGLAGLLDPLLSGFGMLPDALTQIPAMVIEMLTAGI